MMSTTTVSHPDTTSTHPDPTSTHLATTSTHSASTSTHPDSAVSLTVVAAAAGRIRLRFSGSRLDQARARRIQDTVGHLTGVRDVQIYTKTASIVIWYSSACCTSAAILSAIEDQEHISITSAPSRVPQSADDSEPGALKHLINWTARALAGHRDDPTPAALTVLSSRATQRDAEDRTDGPQSLWMNVKLQRAACSATLLTASALSTWIIPLKPVTLGLKVLALALGASTFVPPTLKGLSQGRVGVDTLTVTAALGAVGLGDIGGVAKLACLLSMKEGLDEYSAARESRSLHALLSLAPDHATVERDGMQTVVAAADLRVGDQMIVQPGQRLATDGIIRAGRSALDLCAITGESAPVVAVPGDHVRAGSTNGHAALRVEVTATASTNSLARIVHVLEAEQTLEAAGKQHADRAARPLIAGLVVAAALVAVSGSLYGSPAVWIRRALMLLATGAPYAQDAASLQSRLTVDKIHTLAASRPMIIDATEQEPHTKQPLTAAVA
ncbi:hypothetical protein AO501_07425 [Mycobacterium gordonae]|jgi:cation transport ATPase|uniref:HMA domain-containing protein n=2 Tax=Mycobacteriaceae TaxID=1762 RepID=A0A0Q2LFJ6_MYCGO|nr:hypothetical protein AO501_07425 [Mycobacterium gordonae]